MQQYNVDGLNFDFPEGWEVSRESIRGFFPVQSIQLISSKNFSSCSNQEMLIRRLSN